MNDTDVDNEIVAKGLTAPRVTPQLIDAVIVGEDCHVFNGILTICCLTLRNGFTVTGQSACASPENFDAELGRKIARANAREQIWQLEGYLLKQRLFDRADTGDHCMVQMEFFGSNEGKTLVDLGVSPYRVIFEHDIYRLSFADGAAITLEIKSDAGSLSVKRIA